MRLLFVLGFFTLIKFCAPETEEVCTSLFRKTLQYHHHRSDRASGKTRRHAEHHGHHGHHGHKTHGAGHPFENYATNQKKMIRNRRALNGHPVDDLAMYGYGFIVQVERMMEPKRTCIGMLLSMGWVLTARSCVQDRNSIVASEYLPFIKVRLGIHDTSEVYSVESFEQARYPFQSVLLNLVKPVDVRKATPIALPQTDEELQIPRESVCVLAPNGKKDDEMTSIVYFEFERDEHCPHPKDKFCVNSYGSGPCQKDEGAPLIVFDAERQEFVLRAILTYSNNTKCSTADRVISEYELMSSNANFFIRTIPALNSRWVEPKEFLLPFDTHLRKPITIGEVLHVIGKFHSNAFSFEVNLFSVQPASVVIKEAAAFHLRFYFDTQELVASRIENAVWDKRDEQRVRIPYRRGDWFDLRILILDNDVQIRCNDSLVIKYKPSERFYFAEHLKLHGDALINHASFKESGYPREYMAKFSEIGDRGEFTFGSHVAFYIVSLKNWRLNLIGEEDDDLLFHLSVRFDKRVVVRGSRLRGHTQFDEEETDGGQPFELQAGANVRLTNTENAILVYVNGKEIYSFRHRTNTPNTAYKKLEIEDAVVTDVNFNHMDPYIYETYWKHSS